MLRLAVLICLGAFAAAKIGEGANHCCSAGDRAVVQEQWDELWKDVVSSKLRIGFGKLLITTLVAKHPELKPVFAVVDIDHPDSGKFQAYSLRVLGAVDLIITLLDDDEALDAATAQMAEVMGGRTGITSAHFKTLGLTLKEGLEKVSDHFDPMAWKSCVGGILRKVASKLTPK